MKLLASLLAVLALTACAAPLAGQLGTPAATPSSKAQGAPHCVALYVKALTTSAAPTPGAYACQSASLQAESAKANVHNDLDLEKMAAQSPVFAAPHYIGPMPDGVGYEYAITADNVFALLFVFVDPKTGLVAHFGYV